MSVEIGAGSGDWENKAVAWTVLFDGLTWRRLECLTMHFDLPESNSTVFHFHFNSQINQSTVKVVGQRWCSKYTRGKSRREFSIMWLFYLSLSSLFCHWQITLCIRYSRREENVDQDLLIDPGSVMVDLQILKSQGRKLQKHMLSIPVTSRPAQPAF